MHQVLTFRRSHHAYGGPNIVDYLGLGKLISESHLDLDPARRCLVTFRLLNALNRHFRGGLR
jgi:hypothetical protein